MSFGCVVSLSVGTLFCSFFIWESLCMELCCDTFMLLIFTWDEFLGGRWVWRAFTVSLFSCFQGFRMWLVLVEISWLCSPPASSSPHPLSDCLGFAHLDSIPSSFSSVWGFVLEGSWPARLRVGPLHSLTSWVCKACFIFTTVLRLDLVFSGESFQAAVRSPALISISCPSPCLLSNK